LRFALEFIAKDIRSADQVISNCEGNKRVYCGYFSGRSNVLWFINENNNHYFWLENERIKFEQTGADAKIGYITPASIKINNLRFIISDDGVNKQQSKVTVVMEVEAVAKQAHKQKINLQTTISSRYYE